MHTLLPGSWKSMLLPGVSEAASSKIRLAVAATPMSGSSNAFTILNARSSAASISEVSRHSCRHCSWMSGHLIQEESFSTKGADEQTSVVNSSSHCTLLLPLFADMSVTCNALPNCCRASSRRAGSGESNAICEYTTMSGTTIPVARTFWSPLATSLAFRSPYCSTLQMLTYVMSSTFMKLVNTLRL